MATNHPHSINATSNHGLQLGINRGTLNATFIAGPENDDCLKDLLLTDPRDDKKRISDIKGGVLRDSCSWIHEHPAYRHWRDNDHGQLLWIKGDPGKGKTMLLIDIIDRIDGQRKDGDQSNATGPALSYFFCQSTEPNMNNATAVLRGLMHRLVIERPELKSKLHERYKVSGKKLFEGQNAFFALADVLSDMLRAPESRDAILIVDALDECEAGQERLLKFIRKSSHMKWMVSSRNWPDIEERLGDAEQIQLELHQNSISEAVRTYIHYKVDELATSKKYDKPTKDAVRNHLSANADGTFLWVALVCKELADSKIRRKGHTFSRLKMFPSGLDPLYMRMVEKLLDSYDAELCKKILAIASVVYRPITLQELKVLTEFKNQADYDELPQIINDCGSFLAIRQHVIYLVHQSAKDFLLNVSNKILPTGAAEQHYAIFSKSQTALSKILKRDLCNLGAPGFPIDKVSPHHLDALTSLRYSCVFWVDHLGDSDTAIKDALQDNGDVHTFIRDKYLYWLECLSLLRSMPEGIKAIHKLESLTVSCFAAMIVVT